MKNWNRTQNGLFLPTKDIQYPWTKERFPSNRYLPSRRCCCEGVVACTCTDCETPQHEVPCCINVTLSGLTACTKLWKTWSVRWRSDCTWSCDIPNACSGCGDVTLSVVVSGGYVTVSVGAYTWREAQGDCSMTFTNMTRIASGGGSNPTCSIAPANLENCVCGCSITCARCASNLLASYLEVTIDGLTDGLCTNCNECNGTYVIPLISCARWYKCFSTPSLCLEDEEGTCSGLGVEVLLSSSTPYKWTVNIFPCITTGTSCSYGTWELSTGATTARDCVNIDFSVGSSQIIDDGASCNYSTATITVRNIDAQ